jgi:hypothetical protein
MRWFVSVVFRGILVAKFRTCFLRHRPVILNANQMAYTVQNTFLPQRGRNRTDLTIWRFVSFQSIV